VFAAFDEQARQQRHHLKQIQNDKELREHTDRVRQISEQTQQQAPISTPLTPHTSPDGGSGDSVPLAQEARKIDAIEKLNETRKRNQKKETKRETKIATHASTLSLALAKIKDDETSEESIIMPDRKSQPSKCGICKEAFMSRNALFKHLDEEHKFCREWQQQLDTATHCNMLQPITIHCNTLQHTAPHCNTLQHTATNCNILQRDWRWPTCVVLSCYVSCPVVGPARSSLAQDLHASRRHESGIRTVPLPGTLTCAAPF